MPRYLRLCLLASLSIGAAALPSAAAAAPKTVWLCRPGMKHNPCEPSLRTTVFTPSGVRRAVRDVRPDRSRKIDCFYVYPTVSDQQTELANLHKDPEIVSMALFQAARFSQHCRVYAPVYRQRTLVGTANPSAGPYIAKPTYADVRNAWREYLRKDNNGRGVVIMGHSQGAIILRQLIAREVDPKPAVRRKLVSALLLGGNVLVKRGRDTGGDFKHVKACRRDRQAGCVVAYSIYDGPVPQNSIFGRSNRKGLEVLCTNPARLSGGSGVLDPIVPSRPFAPGTVIAIAISFLGEKFPAASTPWVEAPGSYRAHCSSAGGADVLQVSALRGATTLRPSPDATWGLHLTDVNLGLGNLVDLVRAQAAAYATTH
jgi:hypothetical protein